MPPAGFKHAVSASDRPQTLTLDRLATGIRFVFQTLLLFVQKLKNPEELYKHDTE